MKITTNVLLTNQRLDKLAASRVDFKERGMLEGSYPDDKFEDTEDTEQAAPAKQHQDHHRAQEEDGTIAGPTVLAYVVMASTSRTRHARTAVALGNEIGQPRLLELIRRFLYEQTNPDSVLTGFDVQLDACPRFNEQISIFYSAAATYYAPSDPSGIGGMHREHLRATPKWWGTAPRFDCALVNRNSNLDGIHGLGVVRIQLFFSFKRRGIFYPCALVQWFKRIADEPDEDTGMYIVRPESHRGTPVLSVIHLDTIVRAAHLIGVYGSRSVPDDLSPHHALDAFQCFYLNKFVDHHAFETIY
ncbi:hypothetical protein A0H81_14415 [Grifola frondosa]|uniref:Uncharacterized protein n=1 Tax=Grifola frondosa TaxID=5627 RepID=A0A1C7LM06_GRIFR|nr:hypothetical protein A0H81_14415 [Grifola frondosa]